MRNWLLSLLFVAAHVVSAAACCHAQVVARVNGQPISQGETVLPFFTGQLPQTATPAQKAELLEQLIDRELIKQFLAGKKIVADPVLVEEQATLVRVAIENRGGKPDEVLAKIHLSPAALKDMLSVLVGWEQYVKLTVGEPQMKEHWDTHRAELDGTRVKAAQIVRTLPAEAAAPQVQQAMDLLKDLRGKMAAGQLTFDGAAQQHSQSPSAKQGGSLGEFEFSGRVDAEISRVAFQLKPGEISEPFRSRFGVHLVQVTARIPGQLNAEDARPEILSRLSSQLWKETAAKARETAKIERISQ